jgi:hypothetical protein
MRFVKTRGVPVLDEVLELVRGIDRQVSDALPSYTFGSADARLKLVGNGRRRSSNAIRDNLARLTVGGSVQYDTFGVGSVVAIHKGRSPEAAQVDIDFHGIGTRSLLAYAPIRAIEVEVIDSEFRE